MGLEYDKTIEKQAIVVISYDLKINGLGIDSSQNNHFER
tara:strand:- start:119259 stop:119375 length:117 start_codon:yes stop_codon:yes gene_type:complete